MHDGNGIGLISRLILPEKPSNTAFFEDSVGRTKKLENLEGFLVTPDKDLVKFNFAMIVDLLRMTP
jgi:hypothetical protein